MLTQTEAVATALRTERDALAGQVAALEAAGAEAGERIEGLDAARAEQAAQNAALEARITALNAVAAQAAERIATLVAERDAQAARIAALEQGSEAQAAEVARLEAARAARAAELSEIEASLEAAEAERARALRELNDTATALTQAEEARALELAAAEAVRRRLAEADTALEALTLDLEEARREAEATLDRLAAAEDARARLADDAEAAAEARAATEAVREALERDLAAARQEAAEEARARALLNQNVTALNDQLRALQALLEDFEARDSAQKVQITELGQRLNAALARKVSELARFRSEFFQRMSEVLGGRDDISIVGDRFVFQSEVLFAAGSAELGVEGQTELRKLGDVLRQIGTETESEINWILRVDGHTDATPIRGPARFADNWELSQARALSVVKFLVEEEGVPPDRLAATGFGEFQPLVQSDDPQVFARNRRIEFKFTER
ncbi:MAG: OmpA family protein [Pseudomonadota bacterium]